MKNSLNTVILTDDPLKNIFIMASLLDEAGQNRVFGLICGLISSGPTKNERKKAETAAGCQKNVQPGTEREGKEVKGP